MTITNLAGLITARFLNNSSAVYGAMTTVVGVHLRAVSEFERGGVQLRDVGRVGLALWPRGLTSTRSSRPTSGLTGCCPRWTSGCLRSGMGCTSMPRDTTIPGGRIGSLMPTRRSGALAVRGRLTGQSVLELGAPGGEGGALLGVLVARAPNNVAPKSGAADSNLCGWET